MTTPKARQERVRFAQLLYVAGAAFFGLAVGLALAFAAVYQSSRDSRSATCAVVDAARAEKRIQLQAYDETPPTSPAGRNQQEAYRESLRAWDHLWETQHCTEARNGN
jgi:hypothetical protein